MDSRNLTTCYGSWVEACLWGEAVWVSVGMLYPLFDGRTAGEGEEPENSGFESPGYLSNDMDLVNNVQYSPCDLCRLVSDRKRV